MAGHKAFALIERLSAGPRAQAPTVLAVFRLYCIDELTIPQIARKCRCSLATVANRLRLIRQKTGKAPLDLRAFSKEFVTFGVPPRANPRKNKKTCAEVLTLARNSLC